MCLYPKLIRNPKYMPNKKNGYTPPQPKDPRTLYVPVGCGNCIECRKQKARAWQVRLHEELKTQKHAYFVTLSFSNESLETLCKEIGQTECNAVATKAVRLFLERYRKKYKKSLRHWLITELGHENTERIHLHGVIFPNHKIDNEELQNIWKYGNTYIGDYCNARTINYVVKYVTKIDIDHKNYKAVILASAGLGAAYVKDNAHRHKYTPLGTRETYKLPNGADVNLPIYYRNKLFTEEEREKLWIEKIDTHTRYVLGTKIRNIDSAEGERLYMEVLRNAQQVNEMAGYGTDETEWQELPYNVTLRMLNRSRGNVSDGKNKKI